MSEMFFIQQLADYLIQPIVQATSRFVLQICGVSALTFTGHSHH